jgi:DNA-directed RNA polymerase specialized sigma24 family protein
VIAFAESLDHPADRAVIVLMYLRGMSAVAAGLRMDCSDRTVYRVLRKVMDRLEE